MPSPFWLCIIVTAFWGYGVWAGGSDPGGGGRGTKSPPPAPAVRVRGVRVGGKRVNVTITKLSPDINETMVTAMSEVIMAAESQATKTRIGRRSDNWYAQQHEDVYGPMPYSFAYDVNDHLGNKQYRKEVADGTGTVTGSYGFWAPDGIYRHVDYVADHDGFRAQVKTTEPGTSSDNPADVKMSAAPVYIPPTVKAPSVYPAHRGLPPPPTTFAAPPPSRSAYDYLHQYGSGGEYDWRREGQVRSTDDQYFPPPPPPPASTKSQDWSRDSAHTGRKSVTFDSGRTKSKRPGQRISIPQTPQIQSTRYQTYPPPIVEQIQIKESIPRGKHPGGKDQHDDIAFRTVYTLPREGRTQFGAQGGVMSSYPSNPPPTTVLVTSAPPQTTTASVAARTTLSVPQTTTVPLITTTSHPHDGNVLKNGPLVETFTVTPQRLHKVKQPAGYGSRLNAPNPTNSGPNEYETTTVVSNALNEHGHDHPDHPDHFSNRFNRQPHQHPGDVNRYHTDRHVGPHGDSYEYRGDRSGSDRSVQDQSPVLDWRIAKSAVQKAPVRRQKVVTDEPGDKEISGEYYRRENYDDREWHPFKAAGRRRRHHNQFGIEDSTTTEGTSSAINSNNNLGPITDNRSRYGYTIYNSNTNVQKSAGIRVRDPDLPGSTVYYAENEENEGRAGTTTTPVTVDKKSTASSAFREVATDSYQPVARLTASGSAPKPKPWVRQFYAGESVYGYGVPTLRDHMNEFLHLDYDGDDDYSGSETSTEPSVSPALNRTESNLPTRKETVTAPSTSLKFGDRTPKPKPKPEVVNTSKVVPATEWIKRQNDAPIITW